MYIIDVEYTCIHVQVPSCEINSLQQYLWAAIELYNMDRDIDGN